MHQFKRELGSQLSKDDKLLLEKAKKKLYDVTIDQFKYNVQKAIKNRDVILLRHVLSEIDSPSHSILPIDLQKGDFASDIAKARKLLIHLKDLHKLQRSVADMTRSQIAEIHRYREPPRFVHAVMTSVFILLGEPEQNIKV